MSSIYIQEPPTSGKVLLKTSVGDIDIELWARECPKACRNFVQLCMEGYYNGTIFHRVVKGFIAQGGDPNGDGSGGESIYGEPFKDEFHSRLRFSRRGLVAMANSDKDDNASQFFFTLGATPELQSKHTLFGKVTGDTVFNMLKLEEGLVDHNERPLYPPKIVGAEILSNPFDDIVVRNLKKEEKKEKKKNKEKGVKNFGLLSFGAEAEDDEEETNHFVKKNAGKAKSTHDVLDDPKLSKETLKIKETATQSDIEDYEQEQPEDEEDAREKAERIKNKLSSKKTKKNKDNKPEEKKEDDSEDEDYFKTIEREKKEKRDKKADEIRQEIVSLKKQYKQERKAKDELVDKQLEQNAEEEASSELVKEYITEKSKYSHLKKTATKKGSTSREEFTLALLSKFRNKLDTLREKATDKQSVNDDNIIEDEIQGDDWLSHKLNFEESKAAVLAKDASTKSDDWYDVYDPRNPLNKRKRGEIRSKEDDIKRNKTH